MIGKGVPFVRHQQLGKRLADLNDEFVDLHDELVDAYLNARVAPSKVRDVIHALRALRDALDDVVWDEHPTKASERIYLPRAWRSPSR